MTKVFYCPGCKQILSHVITHRWELHVHETELTNDDKLVNRFGKYIDFEPKSATCPQCQHQLKTPIEFIKDIEEIA